MTGFSTDWLDLREPADHAARDIGLLREAARLLEGTPDRLIVDLGCGTGSTLRALGPHLSSPARWRFVDNDPALLEAAASRAVGWDVECLHADLRDVARFEFAGAGLVTASALFDLVSQDWLDDLAAHNVAVYAALNFDGRIEFREAHPLDEAVGEAFAAHQSGDKGFGLALGPDSPAATAAAFERAGYRVVSADSPWHLDDDELGREFVEGVAGAARETGRLEPAALREWHDFRRRSPAGLVCHRDILAVPRSR